MHSCFWDPFNLVDFMSFLTGGFPFSLQLTGSSESKLQPIFENCGGPLGEHFCCATLLVHCTVCSSPVFALIYFYPIVVYFLCVCVCVLSCLQSFGNEAGHKNKTRFSRAPWPRRVFFNMPSVISRLESCRGKAATLGSSCPLLGVSLLGEQQFRGLQQQVLEAKPPTPICLQIPLPPPNILSNLPSGSCQGARQALPLLFLSCLAHIFSRGLQGHAV